jgi:hypothetical protein
MHGQTPNCTDYTIDLKAILVSVMKETRFAGILFGLLRRDLNGGLWPVSACRQQQIQSKLTSASHSKAAAHLRHSRAAENDPKRPVALLFLTIEHC